MGYPDKSNPGQVRAYLHSVYERYAQGVDVFPRARVDADISELPRKTRQIAGVLSNAWVDIEVDETHIVEGVDYMTEQIRERLDGNGTGLVVARMGRNAVDCCSVSLSGGEVAEVRHTILSGEGRDWFLNNSSVAWLGDHALGFSAGALQTDLVPESRFTRGTIPAVTPPRSGGFYVVPPEAL